MTLEQCIATVAAYNSGVGNAYKVRWNLDARGRPTISNQQHGAKVCNIIPSFRVNPPDKGGQNSGSGGGDKPPTKTITKIYGCPGEKNPIPGARTSGWTGKNCY